MYIIVSSLSNRAINATTSTSSTPNLTEASRTAMRISGVVAFNSRATGKQEIEWLICEVVGDDRLGECWRTTLLTRPPGKHPTVNQFARLSNVDGGAQLAYQTCADPNSFDPLWVRNSVNRAANLSTFTRMLCRKARPVYMRIGPN